MKNQESESQELRNAFVLSSSAGRGTTDQWGIAELWIKTGVLHNPLAFWSPVRDVLTGRDYFFRISAGDSPAEVLEASVAPDTTARSDHYLLTIVSVEPPQRDRD
jgi:hypothetical protein